MCARAVRGTGQNEHVLIPVVVEVAPGGSVRVAARYRPGPYVEHAFAERAIPVVEIQPHHRFVAANQKIRPTVAVEISPCSTVAAIGSVEAAARRHILEPYVGPRRNRQCHCRDDSGTRRANAADHRGGVLSGSAVACPGTPAGNRKPLPNRKFRLIGDLPFERVQLFIEFLRVRFAFICSGGSLPTPRVGQPHWAANQVVAQGSRKSRTGRGQKASG